MRDEAKLVQSIIDREFPAAVQGDALAHMWQAYGAAWRSVREFEPAQRRKAYGHNRLALMEQSLKLFCAKNPGWTPVDHRPDGSTYEFFVMKSKSLVISVKRASKPGVLPKSCDFRDTLTQGAYYPLFDGGEPTPERQFYHILITHNFERRIETDEDTGGHRLLRVLSRPGFVDLFVPRRDAGWLLRREWFKDHAATVAQLRGVAAEGLSENEVNRPKPRRKNDIADIEGA